MVFAVAVPLDETDPVRNLPGICGKPKFQVPTRSKSSINCPSPHPLCQAFNLSLPSIVSERPSEPPLYVGDQTMSRASLFPIWLGSNLVVNFCIYYARLARYSGYTFAVPCYLSCAWSGSRKALLLWISTRNGIPSVQTPSHHGHAILPSLASATTAYSVPTRTRYFPTPKATKHDVGS